MPGVDSKVIDKAGETLFDTVYIPEFVKQCNARGIYISSAEDLELALQNALLIKSAEVSETQNVSNLHKAANAALRGYYGEDVTETEKHNSETARVTAAINDVKGNADVIKAAALLSGLGQETAASA